ncbi:MAG: tRNA (guanine-N1)-methyltransferase [Allomuricauda sp.]|nr:MAG: tRNA (guanine-N1)-methyltransferase [Allomuricauda sp.]
MQLKKTWPFTLFFFACVFTGTYGQEIQSLDEGTIAEQFRFLEKKSGNYNANGVRYEVIRIVQLNKLKNNVLDSIGQNSKTITDLQATIVKNENEVAALKTSVEQTSNELKKITAEKDSISFFGGLLSKGTYKAIMWSTIIGLLLLLLFFIYRFRNSNFLTQQAKASLADLEQEFEQHRRRALEREQKISRQLQDELNKNKKTL